MAVDVTLVSAAITGVLVSVTENRVSLHSTKAPVMDGKARGIENAGMIQFDIRQSGHPVPRITQGGTP